MNWWGSGYITMMIYAGFAEAISESTTIITESNLDLLTELSQDILTET